MSNDWQQCYSGSSAEMSPLELDELLSSFISDDCQDILSGDGVCSLPSDQCSPVSSSDSDSGIDGSPAIDYMDSTCDSITNSSDSNPSSQFCDPSPVCPELAVTTAQSNNLSNCSCHMQSISFDQSERISSLHLNQSSVIVPSSNQSASSSSISSNQSSFSSTNINQSTSISPVINNQSAITPSNINQSAFATPTVNRQPADSLLSTNSVSPAFCSVPSTVGDGFNKPTSGRRCLPVIRIKRNITASGSHKLGSNSLLLCATPPLSNSASIGTNSVSLVTTSAVLPSKSVSPISTGAPLLSNSTHLVSDSASLVPNIVSSVSSPTSLVSHPASLVSNSASLVSNSASLLSNPASLVSNPASLVSNSASLVSNPALLVTCSAPLLSAVSTGSARHQHKGSRMDTVQPIIPQRSDSRSETSTSGASVQRNRQNKMEEAERLRRKHEQTIRNRLAASHSRQRKQQQLLELQHANQQLTRHNQALRDENDALHVRVAELETELALLRTCNSPPPSPLLMVETFSQQQQQWRNSECSAPPPLATTSPELSAGSLKQRAAAVTTTTKRRAVLFSLLLLTTVSVRPLLWQQLPGSNQDSGVGGRVIDYNQITNNRSGGYSGGFASRTLLWTAADDTGNISSSNLGVAELGVNSSSSGECETFGMNATEALRINTALRNVFRLPTTAYSGQNKPESPIVSGGVDGRQKPTQHRVKAKNRASVSEPPVGAVFLNPFDWLSSIGEGGGRGKAAVRPATDGGFLLSAAGAAPWRPSQQLLSALDRQPDRYYVVWPLSGGSLLLLPPLASATNRTGWNTSGDAAYSPRVSVLLPTANTADLLAGGNSTRAGRQGGVGGSRGASTTLLEIDCRVLRTRTVHVPPALESSASPRPLSKNHHTRTSSTTARNSSSNSSTPSSAAVAGTGRRSSR